jgi:hypothetical protein
MRKTATTKGEPRQAPQTTPPGFTVIRHYEPDEARQLKALCVLLDAPGEEHSRRQTA